MIFQVEQFEEVIQSFGRAGGEQRFFIGARPRCFFRRQRQQPTRRTNDVIADLEFGFAAHHAFGQFGVVACFLRGGTDERGYGGDGFLLHGLRHFLHAAKGRHHDGQGVADDGAWRHIDAASGQRDNRSGGEGVLFDKRIDRQFGRLNGAHDVAGRVQSSARRIHGQNDGRRVLAFGFGYPPTDDVEERAFNLAVNGDDVHRGRCGCGFHGGSRWRSQEHQR